MSSRPNSPATASTTATGAAGSASSASWIPDNEFVVEVEPDRFEEMVAEALDGLPEELGRLMRNVAVTVEHGPGPPGLLGLYEGIPLTSRTSQYAGVLPDRITIYRQAICAICRTETEVAEQVRRTVIHEVAHHFGIDDDRLHELGW
jgi:predicted Zn-dependent protease with MMP-like domain